MAKHRVARSISACAEGNWSRRLAGRCSAHIRNGAVEASRGLPRHRAHAAQDWLHFNDRQHEQCADQPFLFRGSFANCSVQPGKQQHSPDTVTMNTPLSMALELTLDPYAPSPARRGLFADVAFVAFLLLIFVTLKPFAVRDVVALSLGDNGTG